MEVHAIEDSILTLPGPVTQWKIESVIMESSSDIRHEKIFRRLLGSAYTKRIWSIDAIGPLSDGLQLQLPMLPHRTDTETGNWIVQGMLENGQIEQTIGFSSSQSDVGKHQTIQVY